MIDISVLLFKGEGEKDENRYVFIFILFRKKGSSKKGSAVGKMYLQCSRFTEGSKMRSDASKVIEKKT